MTHSEAGAGATNVGAGGVTMIDPRTPRFGQTVTMAVLLIGIALQEPLLIVAVAVVLNTAVLTGWRLHLYGILWRVVLRRVVGTPGAVEPAAPHRFANVMGAGMSAIAAVLLLGAPVVTLPVLSLVGYAVAVVHAAMDAIGGLGDYCIGCRMYKQVAFFRRLGVV